MDKDRNHGIPAANIGDVDLVALAKTNPKAANEIARLDSLMQRGEETKEEFLHLCQLLLEVGSVSASEYLLRRNLADCEGQSLYDRLFGTAKQDEFHAAVAAFKSQFGLELKPVDQRSFLDVTFYSDGGPSRSDVFALLSMPCDVEIEYIEQDKIEAVVTLHDPGRVVFHAEENLFILFTNGVWEIADPMDQ